MEEEQENEINNGENENLILNDKMILSKNNQIDGMMKEYKEKNKMRRNFYQKKPLNK